jgi:RNA polymerase sigma factor (sigma-70 family)
VSAAPSLDPSGQAAPAAPALGVDAAQALFERHSAAIYGYCFNRLGGREEAEDAVQTTFLNAFRALRRGVVPEYESAWLHKIAENVCHGRHRSAGRRLEVVQDPTVIAEVAPAVEAAGDELFGLDEALERMAPRQRRALLLREWKGLSYREIGQELRLSPSAVETLLFRARRSLARNLQVGALIPWLKSLLSGSAAVKAAATASVVVAGATLGGDAPLERATRPAQVVTAPASTPSGPRTAASAERGVPREQRVGRADARPASVLRAGRKGTQEGRSRPSSSRRADASRAPVPVRAEPGSAAPAPSMPPHPAAPPPPQTGPSLPAVPAPPPSPPVSLPPTPPAPAPPTLLPELQLPQLPPLPELPGLPPILPPPALPSPQSPQLPQLPPLPPPELPELPLLPENPLLPKKP